MPRSEGLGFTFQDSEGLVWLGTGSGLYMYDGGRMHHFQYQPGDSNSLVNNKVTDIIEDASGDLWIGTEGGISRWERTTGEFRTLLADQKITDLQLRAGENVFAALDNEGVVYFDSRRSRPEPLRVSSFFMGAVAGNLRPSAIAGWLGASLTVIILCMFIRRQKRRKPIRPQVNKDFPVLIRKISPEPAYKNPDSADDEFVKKIIALLEERISDPMFTLNELINEAGMSRATFYRKIKELFNDTPSNLIRTFRLKRAAQLLELQKFQVAEIAYMTGFTDPKYFSKCFYRRYECLPSEYCRNLVLKTRTG